MSTPRLSVVVVSFNRPSLLRACLDALTADATTATVEILVVRNRSISDGPGSDPAIAYPMVKFIPATSDMIVPAMRTLGIATSRGEIVALIEDDCVVERGWCDGMVAAHRGQEVAIGGAVEPCPYLRALDWAVYFCEYGRFMRPLPRDAKGALAGNNVSYKREVLVRFADAWKHGFYDALLHWRWRDLGLPMRAEETLVVRNVNSWTVKDVTNVPFHHGRTFAAQRCAHRATLARLVFAVLALFLPLLQVVRIIERAISRKRLVGRVLRALPWILVFTASWSFGESLGYLTGPGSSPSKWR
jgi:hypothetical protein